MVACSYPSRDKYILRYFTGEIPDLKMLKNKKFRDQMDDQVGKILSKRKPVFSPSF